MNIYLRTGLLLGALLGSLGGCASASNDASLHGSPSGGTQPTNTQRPPDDEQGAEVSFDPTTPVDLGPREVHEVRVVVKPPGAHTVRFALVDARDAALDQGSIVTDVSGRGSVRLTAPSDIRAFSLRAQVGSNTATLSLRVIARSYTRVEIVPRYTGRRPISEWVASVHVAHDCAGFSAIPPDNASFFVRFAPGKSAEIASIPIGPTLAVTVRSGQFAGGCSAQVAPPGEDRLRLEVPVHDRPIDLERTELDVAFGIGAKDPAFLALLGSARARLREAFLDGASTETSALLDAMQGELDAPSRSAFRALRSELAWDTTLGNKGGLNLLSSIERWVSVGQSSLLSERAFEGNLSAEPAGMGGKAPRLRIDRVAERAATDLDAEFSESTWAADASDTLSVSGVLRFRLARLASALAREPAIAEKGRENVAQALASVVDCAGLASRLTSTGPSLLDESCDGSCVTSACERALANLWERASDLPDESRLSIAAAGNASVGNQAQAIAFSGSWVGKLEVDGEQRETSGTVRGAAPRYTAR